MGEYDYRNHENLEEIVKLLGDILEKLQNIDRSTGSIDTKTTFKL